MGSQHAGLEPHHIELIENSPMFFVGTAAAEGRVNISPKGRDAMRVFTPNRVVWMNLTGSGNETAGHLLQIPRMTLMWCAFEGPPMILRAFGSARAVHPGDDEWDTLSGHFTPDPAMRQVFDLEIDLVQQSCGFAVPLMEFQKQRDVLEKWAKRQGPEGLHRYREKKNLETIDGYPTGLKQAEP